MNIHYANSICRWYMAQYVKDKEAQYDKYFPGAEFRFPMPAFFLIDLEQCVEFIERVSHQRLRVVDSLVQSESYYGALMLVAEKNAKRDGMDEEWEREYVSGAAKCRYVVASACRYGGLITAVGSRHFSPAMCAQLNAIREEKLIDLDNKGKAEQGFIDQHDVFMTREEAWEVAITSGQLNSKRYKGNSFGSLHSEDLW